jgi:hypothetical protein
MIINPIVVHLVTKSHYCGISEIRSPGVEIASVSCIAEFGFTVGPSDRAQLVSNQTKRLRTGGRIVEPRTFHLTQFFDFFFFLKQGLQFHQFPKAGNLYQLSSTSPRLQIP